jgi:hypothetical protein
VCDRSNQGFVDRSQIAALLQYSYDVFSPRMGCGSAVDSTLGLGENVNSSCPSSPSRQSVLVEYGPDTVSLILEDLFPPQVHMQRKKRKLQ